MMGAVNAMDLVPLDEAASKLGCEAAELRALLRSGEVPGVYVPDAGGWFVRRADLETRQPSV
jgi:hypothetical protein